MRLPQKIKNFYRRWGVDYNENKRFSEFKNRALSTIDSIMGERFLSDAGLQERFLKLIGEHVPTSTMDNRWTLIPQGIMGELKHFADSPVHMILSEEQDFNQFMRFLQTLFWLDLDPDVREALYLSLKEDIELSMLPVQIKRTGGNDIILYPRGAKLLDENVVNNVLDWLVRYPKTYQNFKSGLEKYQNKIYQRNLVDDLRLAFELLLKKILKNTKPIEKQTRPLDSFLENAKVPTEIKKMFTTLVTYYSKYQNEYVKHDDRVNEFEIEFIVYLTGTFLRYVMILEESKSNAKGDISRS